MVRTLLFSGSLILLVGGLSVVGCGDEPTGGSGGTGATGSTGTGTGTGATGGGGQGGAGGAGGQGGTGGQGGQGGTGGGIGGASSASSSSASSSSASSSSASSSSDASSSSSSSTGMGGSAGAGGEGGTAGSGGAGGSMGPVDEDKDGWTVEEGDCCDNPIKCGKPASVNPGAFEYLGNGIDDDCDPTTADTVPPPDCSEGPLVTPTTTLRLLQAMELCQFTTENAPKPQKKWGVITSDVVLADGTKVIVPKNVQYGVLSKYGPNVTPRKGATFAALSTGTARAPGDPGHVYPQNGPLYGTDPQNPGLQKGNFVAGTSVSAPAEYLLANGGKLPSPATCPACSGDNCTTAYDSVNLKVRIRVPTNAKSFSYRLKSYTSEYPEYTCQAYNDFFLTLLKSSWVPPTMDQQPLPADHNIAKDALGNPITVNNAFYEVCYPYMGAPAGACPSGTLELVGTGIGGWNNDFKDGGGTEWLINEAPVVPGETIDIQFIIADAGDSNVDSIVLLDYFRWGLEPTPVGVHK